MATKDSAPYWQSTSDNRVIRCKGVPIDGVTGAGAAYPGTTCVDDDSGINYHNYGTQAFPVWKGVLTT